MFIRRILNKFRMHTWCKSVLGWIFMLCKLVLFWVCIVRILNVYWVLTECFFRVKCRLCACWMYVMWILSVFKFCIEYCFRVYIKTWYREWDVRPLDFIIKATWFYNQVVWRRGFVFVVLVFCWFLSFIPAHVICFLV